MNSRITNSFVRRLLTPILVVWLTGIGAPLLRGQEKIPKPSEFVPKGYRLVWNDEFDGPNLDLKKWQYRQLGKRDGAIIAKESVTLDGKGFLRLSTFKKDDVIHSGMIGTEGKFLQKYGYFESRIKFQSMQGHHGSFWLQSPTYGKFIDDPGKSGAEIDIIEYFGAGRKDRGGAVNVYWNPYKPKALRAGPKELDLEPILGKPDPAKKPAPELSDDFHVYALNWTDKGYVFLIDGKELYRTTEGLSHQAQNIVLSLLCSDWERKRLDDSKLPEAMIVDYVRVYASGKK
ncbi:glycoside hydrolase family 16 protein [Zavarzinella formosa]|uniref:glycoside hydrolase family 16 protein n=1 Tax=Zavarzinella formosa TaxID=360055 RepID=UPI0003609316|nr:glycoside hydrolase family 16 protein [Zavarzinella formosa]